MSKSSFTYSTSYWQHIFSLTLVVPPNTATLLLLHHTLGWPSLHKSRGLGPESSLSRFIAISLFGPETSLGCPWWATSTYVSDHLILFFLRLGNLIALMIFLPFLLSTFGTPYLPLIHQPSIICAMNYCTQNFPIGAWLSYWREKGRDITLET